MRRDAVVHQAPGGHSDRQAGARFRLRFLPAAPADPKERGSSPVTCGRAPRGRVALGTVGSARRSACTRTRLAARIAAAFFSEFQHDILDDHLLNTDYSSACRSRTPRLHDHGVRLFHQSSHLGDEYMSTPMPAIDLTFQAVSARRAQTCDGRVWRRGLCLRALTADLSLGVLPRRLEFRQPGSFGAIGRVPPPVRAGLDVKSMQDRSARWVEHGTGLELGDPLADPRSAGLDVLVKAYTAAPYGHSSGLRLVLGIVSDSRCEAGPAVSTGQWKGTSVSKHGGDARGVASACLSGGRRAAPTGSTHSAPCRAPRR